MPSLHLVEKAIRILLSTIHYNNQTICNTDKNVFCLFRLCHSWVKRCVLCVLMPRAKWLEQVWWLMADGPRNSKASSKTRFRRHRGSVRYGILSLSKRALLFSDRIFFNVFIRHVLKEQINKDHIMRWHISGYQFFFWKYSPIAYQSETKGLIYEISRDQMCPCNFVIEACVV